MNTAPFPQLQAFLAVARLRSFSSAARELGVTRSAVSHAVQQLEEQLRVVLLTRTTRSVSVTDTGRRLMESAGPAFGQVVAALGDRADVSWFASAASAAPTTLASSFLRFSGFMTSRRRRGPVSLSESACPCRRLR